MEHGKVQIVLSFDTTGSMFGCLDEVRKNLDEITDRLYRDIPHIEIAVFAHGDYTDSYVTQYIDFTSEVDCDKIKTFLDGVKQTNGGDFPKCYELVLNEVGTKLSWTPGSHRVLVMIGDAVAHKQADSNNCSRLEWRQEAQILNTEKDVRIYGVQSVGSLTSPKTTQFWKELSEIGGGSHYTFEQNEILAEILVAITLKEAQTKEQHSLPSFQSNWCDSSAIQGPVQQPDLARTLNSLDIKESVHDILSKLIQSSYINRTSGVIALPPLHNMKGFGDTPELGIEFHSAAHNNFKKVEKSLPTWSDYQTKVQRKLSRAWRDLKFKWDIEEYTHLQSAIAHRRPILKEAVAYNILMCGIISAGKSSVINTFISAMRNEISQIAQTENNIQSVTKKYRVHKLCSCPTKKAVNVNLCDSMGIEVNGDGPDQQDIEYILGGHIKDGYEFAPDSSIPASSPYFVKNPTDKDKIHVMVLVIEGRLVTNMPTDVISRLQQFTRAANDRNIRWAVIMTKIDIICCHVGEDIRNVFFSEETNDVVYSIHNVLGALISNIFPMQNYDKQLDVNIPMNILALDTLNRILRLADNSLEDQTGPLPEDNQQPYIRLQLDTPWRNDEDLKPQAFKKYVETTWKEIGEEQDKKTICLIGPSGAGKSAFVNSVLSEFCVKQIRTTADTGRKCPTTTRCCVYPVQQGRDGPILDVELIDTMGILPDEGGILLSDVMATLDGQVEHKQAYNPEKPLDIKSATSVSQKAHVMALMVNGRQFSSYSSSLIDKLKEVIKITRDVGREIPCVVLVTHIDGICQLVESDPCMVFCSKKVKACVLEIQDKLQIPLVDIWPVYNYVNDTELDAEKSAILLKALSHLIERAQDFIAHKGL